MSFLPLPAKLLPPDHPQRALLAAEVLARVPEPLSAPCRATYVAVRIDAEALDAELAHIAVLCDSQGLERPPEHATHWSAAFGVLRLKWERHGEFSSYTFFSDGFSDGLSSRPFSEPVVAQLPPGWLAAVPGQTVFAAHAILVVANVQSDGAAAIPAAEQFATHFGQNMVVGSRIGDGAGLAFTDFVIHDDGFARFLLFDKDMSARSAGRMLQRLFEIEAYRMMALLALPIARELWPRLMMIERTLVGLIERIARDASEDEDLLHRLTALATEVESALAASQFRFGASRAYHALITTRIGELREQRIRSLQNFDEFMTRRLSPAMATCATVSQRLGDLSDRVAQASNLLSTRVNIVRERQNQELLTATARRAALQLKLQQTVEGLSLAAIVYYLSGLLGYGAKALKTLGVPISPDLVIGAAVPVLALVGLLLLRRARRHMGRDSDAGAA